MSPRGHVSSTSDVEGCGAGARGRQAFTAVHRHTHWHLLLAADRGGCSRCWAAQASKLLSRGCLQTHGQQWHICSRCQHATAMGDVQSAAAASGPQRNMLANHFACAGWSKASVRVVAAAAAAPRAQHVCCSKSAARPTAPATSTRALHHPPGVPLGSHLQQHGQAGPQGFCRLCQRGPQGLLGWFAAGCTTCTVGNMMM